MSPDLERLIELQHLETRSRTRGGGSPHIRSALADADARLAQAKAGGRRGHGAAQGEPGGAPRAGKGRRHLPVPPHEVQGSALRRQDQPRIPGDAARNRDRAERARRGRGEGARADDGGRRVDGRRQEGRTALAARQKEVDAEKKTLAEELATVQAALTEATEKRTARIVVAPSPSWSRSSSRSRARARAWRSRRPRATASARCATCACGRRCSSKSAATTDHPVRQLSPHPLLHPATAAGRTGCHARVDVRRRSKFEVSMSQPSLFGPPGGRSARANIDGGSRGNPGPAGYGVRIERGRRHGRRAQGIDRR